MFCVDQCVLKFDGTINAIACTVGRVIDTGVGVVIYSVVIGICV